jgi:transposase-like protein
MATKHPSSRRYPPEVKERAIQFVLTTMDQNGERHGVIARTTITPSWLGGIRTNENAP